MVLEVELEPAATVDADALARLGLEIDGHTVQNAFAVAVPGQFRQTDQRHLAERLAAARDLRWREWRIDGTSGPRLSGDVADLGRAADRAVPPSSNLQEGVDELADGVRRAGARLYRSQGALARVADTFGTQPGDETAHMAALVVTNAMIFQERLAGDDPRIQPVNQARVDGRFARLRLLDQWDTILDIDYYPIFNMARSVVSELSGVTAADVLDECARTAERLLEMGTVGRHDLAGRIFNQLIAERKLLAAFYTSIPAATLLAGLALAPARWPGMDWSAEARLRQLRVVDPACGTGTLLMAAYQQIMQNRSGFGGPAPDDVALHRALVEHTLFGADVVPSAIHITAATLAAMSPTVGFEEMQLHSLTMGVDPESVAMHGSFGRRPSDIRLGSLDWLQDDEAQSSFSATREQIGAVGSAGTLVERPRADLVISNPPYTRRGSDGGKGAALARVLDVPEGDDETRRAIARRTSQLLKGTPANQMAGHAASFTVLADRLVKPNGRVALVLPVTALAGESWRRVRAMLANRYAIELVISSHDPDLRSMSFDTHIAEVLLLARRLRPGERPPRRGGFANLWRAPRRETDALALANAINATSLGRAAPLGRAADWRQSAVRGRRAVGRIAGRAGGRRTVDRFPLETGPDRAVRRSAGKGRACGRRTDHGSWRRFRSRRWRMSATWGRKTAGFAVRSGVFDAYHGWDEQAQFPALWAQSQKVHQGLVAEPNARLFPATGPRPRADLVAGRHAAGDARC